MTPEERSIPGCALLQRFSRDSNAFLTARPRLFSFRFIWELARVRFGSTAFPVVLSGNENGQPTPDRERRKRFERQHSVEGGRDNSRAPLRAAPRRTLLTILPANSGRLSPQAM